MGKERPTLHTSLLLPRSARRILESATASVKGDPIGGRKSDQQRVSETALIHTHLAALTFWRLLIAAWSDEWSVADHGWRKFLLFGAKRAG
jgi:hypothetical protein